MGDYMDEKKYAKELTFDHPIIYMGVAIHPAKMVDYLEFHTLANCLLLDKDTVPDMKIISMSYLDYLFYLADNGDRQIIFFLDQLLRMVLNIPSHTEGTSEEQPIQYFKNEKGKAVLKINDVDITSTQFDEIRHIICMQNLLELPDDSIDLDVRKAMAEAEDLKRRQSAKMCSLEEQMLCIIASTSLTLVDIENLSIRKFVKLLQRIDHKLHYEIYKSASMSGFVTFKNKDELKHWMGDLTKDKFEGVTTDVDEIRNKMNGKPNGLS